MASLGLVSAQGSTQVSVCAAGCVNGVIVNAANIGCPNGDTLCVCGNTASFNNGVRDCITQACASEPAAEQIPLAQSYGEGICSSASAAAAPTPTPSTAAPTTTEAVPTTSTAAPTTTAAASSVESSSSTASKGEASSSSVSSSATSAASSTTSSATSASTHSTMTTSTSSQAIASKTSDPTATPNPSDSSDSSSTALKAGIGAGVGAAVLAAAIIAACACLRRRQKKKPVNPARAYKISEPMRNSQFASDIGRAETADTVMPAPINTAKAAARLAPPEPASPTSVYSYVSDPRTSRRYEDSQPKTKPRTMV
ncbi:hypothetical protein GGR50DRAFT_696817 [Xylaria sp. CBS 124048]|nr:hypothetical protein GGR50DRAFT_696817 [Xylaria sp. CBS 124048]